MPQRCVKPDQGPEGGWIVTDSADTVRSHTTTQAGAVEDARDGLRAEGGGTIYLHSPDGSLREQRASD